jgi:hypothetical protein
VIRGAGAVVVVVLAMLLACGVTLAALTKVADDERATLVTALFTLLGTLVGAYTGVRVGSEGAERARTTAAEETIKASELSAALAPAEAQQALERAQHKIQQRRAL